MRLRGVVSPRPRAADSGGWVIVRQALTVVAEPVNRDGGAVVDWLDELVYQALKEIVF